MSGARKLQTEIDRVMKKVDEGVELFDEIWEKVYAADTQNQKEKYEMDLKKEIKKLQRLRDQIKTWISSNDVKDKDHLVHARKLIESKMEQFKICEKETKTKAYSKEGLAKAERLDPAEQAKRTTTKWIGEFVDKLQELADDKELEIERLSSGKGKKTNKHQIEECNHFIANHKFHINKLEGIMRLVNNDRLDVESVDSIREDLEYYIESYEDEDYQQAYDEEFFYEPLGLDDMDVVNVDRVTQVSKSAKETAEKETHPEKSHKHKKEKKSKASSTMIPLTIGRARSNAAKKEEEEKKTPSKRQSTKSITEPPAPALGPAPTTRPPPVAANSGQSMAAMLKTQRESEQAAKEKLRQQEAQAAQIREQQRQAELQRQQELLQQQEELRQQEALRQQQQQQQAQQQAQQEAALKQRQLEQVRQQQEAAAKQQKLQAQQAQAQQAAAVAAQQDAINKQRASQVAPTAVGSAPAAAATGGSGIDILNVGLGSLTIGSGDRRQEASPMGGAVSRSHSTSGSGNLDLNESFLHMPTGADSERPRSYTPRNPYPTPASYPTTPSGVLENPAVFEKLGTDCLFFIFYYAQGTYQQYLAARELKKQSWRYHKKYMTWFQRHEEPKVKTDEYEQGTYVYFDYETGWCQRIKSDFRFEYSFLEDSLQ
uniref:CCR4-NOT transcription complex subunit 3 n=1 Tax=Grammatophora oceanica TaxID=210454 RepID=A0A7S1UQS1_9STRA|mmetsp:Transcript_17853/g.26435  ORF Transcript_17853/g.26435 Transcript_17853/m.26435 type:complete len:656 (+) Transcript_17853:96-2063(+)|eukprot:CAMPEP_0194037714 /NCGR_PEP_ID=MMETSP0009_2-20130614/10036_1 /TAXON_ID=210454 /ORGANISM="Grammatophora oceanica, Strain CCMP 410" /LENGTH=655 /DNA_ID=CAMNT_0038679969 /DNA_START=27 /DNA_END=1994 /DNA_ORIENTATION=+